MFTPHKSDHGTVIPWEYRAAAAGTYQAGQLVTVTNGKVSAISGALATTPPYLCMANKTCEAGELLPVTRVRKDHIYETTLAAAADEATVGTKLQVAAGGLQASGAAAGTFEVVSIEGTAAGDIVRGRWV